MSETKFSTCWSCSSSVSGQFIEDGVCLKCRYDQTSRHNKSLDTQDEPTFEAMDKKLTKIVNENFHSLIDGDEVFSAKNLYAEFEKTFNDMLSYIEIHTGESERENIKKFFTDYFKKLNG